MDYRTAVYKLLGPTTFNPACFNFSEQEARDKKLWSDPRPMPSIAEIQATLDEHEQELAAIKYKEDRRKKYEAQGLSFDSFVEMLIENDQAGMAEFRSKRDAIKTQHPKP